MPEYICCRSCDSPSCKGCNIYTLSTMLNKGKLDSLMNDNRSINPTADVSEVKHGEWKIVDSDLGWVDGKCSACGYTDCFDESGFYKFCPECGAKMDLTNS